MAGDSSKLLLPETNENEPFKSDNSKSLSSESETTTLELVQVTISIREYRNIVSIYPIGVIKTTCTFDNTIIGETGLLPLTDDDTHESGDSFTLEMKKCPEDIDKLLSLPAILTVYQHTGNFDYTIYEQLTCTPVVPVKSTESQYSVYEAIVDAKESTARITTKKEKSLNKKVVSSSEDQKSEAVGTDSPRPKLKPVNAMSMMYGMCVIDFLPLFRGKCEFSETLPIKTMARFEVDGITKQQRVPTIVIDVSIDTALGCDQHTIAHFTLESIYNLPRSILDMNCSAAVHFPSFENSACGPILFKGAVISYEDRPNQFKCWPNMPEEENNANTTKYRLNQNSQDILCKLDRNLDECLHQGIPRLTFNMVKRVLMDERALDKLCLQVETFKHILLEFYFSHKGIDLKLRRSPLTKSKDAVHCMALVRVSNLTHPGETKLRIAVPIIKFNIDEAITFVGPIESFFVPVVVKKSFVKPTMYHSPKRSKDKEKEKKTDASSQTAKLDVKQNVNDSTLDSRVDFYKDTCIPIFAIIEIELTKPLVPKLNVEALTDRLEMFLRPPEIDDEESGSLMHLREEYFGVLPGQEEDDMCCEDLHVPTCGKPNKLEEVVFNIVLDVQCRFSKYIDSIPELRDQPSSAYASRFPEFLDKIGAYTRYNSTLADALATMVSNRNIPVKSCVCEDCNRPSLGEKAIDLDSLFRDATKTVNRVVNRMAATDMRPRKARGDTFLYVKEASEMGMVLNGERILLARMCTDDRNADYWFEYAVFLIEHNQLKNAMKCVHEGVMRNGSHKYCLLIYGMLLEQRNRKVDAETMLLNVVAKEPRWFEGWGVLYLFYMKYNNDTGMEWAVEEMRKLSTISSPADEFSRFEDLPYDPTGTEQSIPTRLVRFLIKLRMFSWAEVYMTGITEERYALDMRYLSAVVSYYKRDYGKCIQTLEELKPKVEEGRKNNITALQGHCLANLGRDEEALACYHTIFETLRIEPNWNPLHLVSLKYAKLLMKYPSVQNLLDAKDALLRFCQCKQTPLTWLLLGHICYTENNFLHAELCLEKGNLLDNCNGDIWALLAMVNIKLGNYDTAEICFTQAKKNGFDTVEYGTEVEMKLKARQDDDERLLDKICCDNSLENTRN